MDFHEVGFGATLNGENGQPFWFQLSDTQRQQVGDPWGPQNPQALNRYSYVQNNAVKYTDPSGHSARCKRLFGYDICLAAVNVVNNSDYPIEVTGDSWDEDCQCYRQKLLLLAQESLHVTMASLMLIRCALFVQSIPLMGMEQVSIMIQAVPVRSMLKMTQGPIMSVIYI